VPDTPPQPDNAEAIDFNELDLYAEGESSSDSSESEAGEGGDAPPPSPPKGEPPATPPAQTDDPIYEIPSLGQVRASEIRNLWASRDQFSRIEEERQRLTQERERIESESRTLSEAIQMRDLLNFPAVRTRFQQAMGELFGSGNVDGTRDDQGEQFFQQLPPQLKPSTPSEQKPPEDPRIAELMARETRRDINDLFGELHRDNPEIVTQQFADQVMDVALEMYREDPDALGVRELRIIAGDALKAAKLSASGRDEQEIAQALKNLEPGTRVVTRAGGRASAEPPQKDPRKMEWSELEKELGEELYAED